MVFAQEYRKELRTKYPDTDNKEISKMLGQRWKGLNNAEKTRYAKEADRLAEQHKIDHPDWKFVRAPPREGRGKIAKAKAAAEAAVATTAKISVGAADGEITAASADVSNVEAAAKPNDLHLERELLFAIRADMHVESAMTQPTSPRTTTSPEALTRLLELHQMQKQLLRQAQQLEAVTAIEHQPPPPSYVAPPEPPTYENGHSNGN